MTPLPTLEIATMRMIEPGAVRDTVATMMTKARKELSEGVAAANRQKWWFEEGGAGRR
jgi:hypothetical protein